MTEEPSHQNINNHLNDHMILCIQNSDTRIFNNKLRYYYYPLSLNTMGKEVENGVAFNSSCLDLLHDELEEYNYE
jgi:hypothetical protein